MKGNKYENRGMEGFVKKVHLLLLCLVLIGLVQACGNGVHLKPTHEVIPTLEPAAAPEYGSRSSPVPFLQPMPLVYNEAANFDIQVLSVIRGQEAFQALLDENQFNDPPLEGMEYMLVKIGVDYLTSNQQDLLVEISSYDFKSVSNNQILDSPFAMVPEPELDVSLFPGGHGEGFIALQVYANDPAPLIVFNQLFDDNMFFFAIQQEKR